MKKITLSLCLLMAAGLSLRAQVGVNTTAPQATLDIRSSNNAGSNEGILIPRLSKSRIASVEGTKLQEGTLVYVDNVDASTESTVSEISQKGFYYYDPSSGKWKALATGGSGLGTDTNLYNTDGTLAANRTVDLDGKNLVFKGTGKVGIGTSTPEALLHTQGTGPLLFERYGGGPNLLLRMAKGSLAAPAFPASGDPLGVITIYPYDATTHNFPNRTAAILMTSTETHTNTAKGSKMTFTTTPNGAAGDMARMTINHDGNVGIGTETPTAKLHVEGGSIRVSLGTIDGPALSLFNPSKTGGAAHVWSLYNMTGAYGNSLQFFRYPASGGAISTMVLTDDGNVGIGTANPTSKLQVMGVITSGATLYTSDVRMKKNIVPVTHALETVKQLRAVEYDKKDSMEATQYTTHELGFIAQELQKVLPQIVVEGKDKDRTLTVNYTSLIPILVKAMQEQQVTIEKQQTEIEQLKKHLK